MLTELATGKPSAPGPGAQLGRGSAVVKTHIQYPRHPHHLTYPRPRLCNSQWTCCSVAVHSHSRGPGAPWPRLCSCQHPLTTHPHHPHIKYPHLTRGLASATVNTHNAHTHSTQPCPKVSVRCHRRAASKATVLPGSRLFLEPGSNARQAPLRSSPRRQVSWSHGTQRDDASSVHPACMPSLWSD